MAICYNSNRKLIQPARARAVLGKALARIARVPCSCVWRL